MPLNRSNGRGDAHAQFILGSRYALGEGVKKDLREAAQWWRKAADQGHPGAQYNLGLAHMLGDGVPVDSLASYPMFREAAHGYKRWEREGVHLEGMDLKAARREARRMCAITLPFFVVKSIQLVFASMGLGRHRFSVNRRIPETSSWLRA